MMPQRNLLYTAVTRTKQLVVLVGSPRALSQAVRATGSGRRHTALAHRLRGDPGGRRDGTRLTPGYADSERPTRRTRRLSCGSSEEGSERLPKPARCVGTRS
jgi:exodeoxyribonuclease V alpha subunit